MEKRSATSIEDLKKRLNLPVIGAPMFLTSGIDLVVAQCCAGVVGAFPALNARAPETLSGWLDQINQRLSAFQEETGIAPAPYAVNLIVHPSNPRLDEDIATCVAHKVPLVITSLSAPDKVVEAVHSYGGLVFHDVISARHARKAAGAGVDGIVLVCAGAGGHGGNLSPFALVNEVREFFDGALALSGAITSGREILAAEVLGCDFAYIGTRFLASQESIADMRHKDMVVASGAADIVYTPMFSGTSGNYLAGSLEAAGIDVADARAAQPRKMNFGEDKPRPKMWKEIWGAGQGAGNIKSVLPASEIVEQMHKEYGAAAQNQRDRMDR